MKIRSVRIHNFRGILDAFFQLQDYVILVGPNNSGKSTVVDAIRAFYEKDSYKYKKDRDFPFSNASDAESWVELEFALTQEEYSSLKDEYKMPPDRLRVRKFLQTAEKDSEGKTRANCVYAYTAAGQLADEQFYGAKGVQLGKLGTVIYVPAVSTVDEHTKLSGPSALRDLLSGVVQDVAESSPSLAEFRSQFDVFSAKLKDEKTADGRSLTGLELALNTRIAPWDVKFSIQMDPPSEADIIKSLVSPVFFDSNHSHELAASQFGSGFQRHFIYSLICVAADYAGAKTPPKKKEFSPTMNFLLFEEPEAFLHPPQQLVLARGMQKIAKGVAWQVLCSTHSSHFMSRNTNNITSLVRLRRDQGKVTVYQMTPDKWQAIADANAAILEIAKRHPSLKRDITSDDYKPEMEALRYFLWLNAERCSAFFADRVLLVEGPTEQVLVNRLLELEWVQTACAGVYVMDVTKYNIHRFMKLFEVMGINHAVLHDDDHCKNEHGEINTLIAASSNGFTSKIAVVPGDLEALLGLPKCRSNNKPKQALHALENTQIDKSKMKAFCDLVSACLA